MQFVCQCGYCFHDNTDNQFFKASLIAEQDVDEFTEIVHKAERPHRNHMEIYFDLWNLMGKNIYQCPECGTIYIDDFNEEHRLYGFTPIHANTPRTMTQSVHGEKWKGCLTAYWEDAPEPSGAIYPEVNTGIERELYFDDYEELKAKYLSIFEELKEKGVLYRSILLVNGTPFHQWHEIS